MVFGRAFGRLLSGKDVVVSTLLLSVVEFSHLLLLSVVISGEHLASAHGETVVLNFDSSIQLHSILLQNDGTYL